MSRAVQSPCVRHWGAMKKALRYIAGTMDYALYYDIDVKADDNVHVVVDASWASGEGRNSTSGGSVCWR
eukprot:7313072-Heterocapsa_arctica.AAC.1